jgi:hypothetical protein
MRYSSFEGWITGCDNIIVREVREIEIVLSRSAWPKYANERPEVVLGALLGMIPIIFVHPWT